MKHVQIPQLLNKALRFHQAGRIQDAVSGYQEILKKDPTHCDALHLLGVAAQQLNQLDASIQLIKAAIEQNPKAAPFHHNLANSYLQNNMPLEALQSYHAALQLNPNYAEAHNGMGNALVKLKQEAVALEAYQNAIRCNPNLADAHYSAGRVYSKLLRFKEAIPAYRAAVQLNGNCFDYYFNLGNALLKASEYEEAIPVLKRALKLQKGDPELLCNLGFALEKVGETEKAEEIYLSLLESSPNYSQLHNNYGKLLANKEKYNEAVVHYKKAIQLDPQNAYAYFNLGVICLNRNEDEEAEENFRAALTIESDLPEANYNLGNIFRKDFRLAEAIACYRRATETPNEENKHKALTNLALTLYEVGEIEESLTTYQAAVQLDPTDNVARVCYAYALMTEGRLQEGLPEHEARFHTPDAKILRDIEAPLWRGEPLNGAKILIYWEQGLGDTLQFIRYIPLVAQRGGRVILEVQEPLRRLIANIPGVDSFICHGDQLPDISWQCPLMSLPLAFGTTFDSIPASAAYISVPPERVRAAAVQFSANTLRVGLVWSGNPKHKLDAHRSMQLAHVKPLLELEGVTFFALQPGEVEKQLAANPDFDRIENLGPQFTDFLDTAAAIANLDLVISVDTSVAHLAGAMGMPTWVLIHHNRIDWRWFREGDTSPWYPSARIFRQPASGDWESVIQTVKEELKLLLATKKQGRTTILQEVQSA